MRLLLATLILLAAGCGEDSAPVAPTSPLPSPPSPAPAPEPEPEPAPLPCQRSAQDRPDDFSGPQFHFLYVVASDGADLALDTDCTIREMVANIQGSLAAVIGKEFRVDTFRGEPDVTFLRAGAPERGMIAPVDDGVWSADLSRMLDEIDPVVSSDKLRLVFYTLDFERSAPPGTRLRVRRGLAMPEFGIAALSLSGSIARLLPGADSEWRWRNEHVVIHEAFHLMGAVPRCAPHFSEQSPFHVYSLRDDFDDFKDVMAASGPTGAEHREDFYVDFRRDDYYGHGRPDCLDISESPFFRLTN